MRAILYPNGELRINVGGVRPRPRNSSDTSLTCLSFETCDLPDELSSAKSLQQPQPEVRRGYGGLPTPRKFSLYARRMLARCGGALDPAESGRLVFLTGTLPGGTSRALEALARHSSWIAHQLVTVIPRLVGYAARDLSWMWVWEHQRRGALHWHMAIELPTLEAVDLLLHGFRGLWSQLLRSLSKRTGIDVFERADGGTWSDRPSYWRVDAQVAKKSPSNYLAKYLSKGSGPTPEGGPVFFSPTQWYQCSRRLLERARALTLAWESDSPEARRGSVSDQDLDWMQRAVSAADKVIPFGHKYSQGVTVVCYADDGYDVYNQLIQEAQRMQQNVPGSSLFSKKTHLPKWPQLDRALSHPRTAARLYNALGELDTANLVAYEAGDLVPCSEIEFLEWTAAHVLTWEGFVSSQGPASGRSEPLTADVCPDAGDPWFEGDYRTHSLFEDL